MTGTTTPATAPSPCVTASAPTPTPASRWAQLRRDAASVYAWGAIASCAIVGNSLQAILYAVTTPLDPTRKLSGSFGRAVARTAVRLMPQWDFGVHGPYPKKLERPTVVVSNHVSHGDCFLIVALPFEMKWLAKSSLFRIPFVGWLIKLCGDIPVERGTGPSIAKAMRRCRWYLERNMPVCVFPEGTRSKDGKLQKFKAGAFRLAIDTNADLLPIAVRGTQHGLPKHSWRFKRCVARVMVGKPIRTNHLTTADVDKLSNEARAQIEHMLKELESVTSG